MLLKTIAEIKFFIAVNSSTNMDSVAPYIDMAELKYLVPAIGKAQYDALHTAYNANTLSAAQTVLLVYAQRVVSNLAFTLYMPMAMVQISDAGVQIISDAHAKTAWEWQIEKLVQSFRENGFNAIEELLGFMEANKADYPLWVASTAFTENKELFICSAVDFSKYYNIGNSRRLFNELRFIIRKVENAGIKPLLGAEYFAALKTSIAAGTTSDKDLLVLDFLKAITAYLSIGDACNFLPIRFTEEGFVSLSTSDRLTMNVKTVATDQRLAVLQQAAMKEGAACLQDLRDFLFANKDDYPLYVSGGDYTEPALQNNNPYKNGEHSNIFFA